MTFKELINTLNEMESMGVDLDNPALLATEGGVRKVKKVFVNGQMAPYMDIRNA